MSLRTRLLLAFGALVLLSNALLALGLRQEMARRLRQEYQARVDQVIQIIREDLTRESAAIDERLASLESALLNDSRFRLAAVAGVESERAYLLDYAGGAMRLTGLTMLQIQSEDGRILSSGHFRNEHGRIESGLAPALASARGAVFVTARGAEREFLTLARARSLRLAGRPFTIVGGVTVDEPFLARLSRDGAILVSLTWPGGRLSTGRAQVDTLQDAALGELPVPLIRAAAETPGEVLSARLRVTQSLAPLRTLLRSADAWLLVAAAGTGAAAVLLAVWLSSRLSRRLAALAEQTAVLDLDRLDIDVDPGADEVGTLSRLLGDLVERLRISTVRIREAERRATIGELARQVNHDIKNGLIPLRNVMRHLAQVERDTPGALPTVFAERRATLDSSMAYLETLATSYLRLARPLERREFDPNTVIGDVVRTARGRDHVEFVTDLANLPRVVGDPLAFRRILENLTTNAVDSLQSRPGRITVSTQVIDRGDAEPPGVGVTVADTGCGMSAEEAGRIFTDFYTTKEGGSGLGLSIVRRLVMDLNGAIRVDSAPGSGTRVIIEIPANSPQSR
jgi:signal transduction histidine kinase